MRLSTDDRDDEAREEDKMSASTTNQAEHEAVQAAQWRSLHRIAGVAAGILVIYSLITMILLIFVGGQPETAEGAFAMLEEKRATGLLRLDILTFLVMPLYYVVFLSLYKALKGTHAAYASLAAVLAFAGITLVLATPSVLSLASLSDRFAAATTGAERARLLAAGEAILASDLRHGTGAIVGAVLLPTASVMISVLMLWHEGFGDLTAAVGIAAHGLDLAHVMAGLLLPGLGVLLLAMAGSLRLVWFPLLARDLLRLGQAVQKAREP